MERSHREKTTALQRSIELGTTLKLDLLHPTRYKQHNPNLRDGIEGVGAIHDLLPHDQVYAHVVRAFEDGDYAFVHVDYHLFSHTVAFDIHRYEQGVAVEHWDNLQEMTLVRNKSGRTMTDGKTQVTDLAKTQVNKDLARRFTQDILIEQRLAALATYFKDDYLIQHNPHMGDGVQEFLAVRAQWAQQGAAARYDTIQMVLGEGNFVLVVSEGAFQGKPSAFYDLYRLADDKILEHWDVVEEIPAEANRQNNNGKF